MRAFSASQMQRICKTCTYRLLSQQRVSMGNLISPLQFGQRGLSEQFLMGSAGAIGTLSATRLTFATVNAEFDKKSLYLHLHR